MWRSLFFPNKSESQDFGCLNVLLRIPGTLRTGTKILWGLKSLPGTPWDNNHWDGESRPIWTREQSSMIKIPWRWRFFRWLLFTHIFLFLFFLIFIIFQRFWSILYVAFFFRIFLVVFVFFCAFYSFFLLVLRRVRRCFSLFVIFGLDYWSKNGEISNNTKLKISWTNY